MGRGLRVLGGVGRLLRTLLTNPRQGVRQTMAAFESVRMRWAKDSTFRRKSDLVHASSCPEKTITIARDMWNPRSVIDVGCGTGRALDFWLKLGVAEVVGLEGSQVAIEASVHPELIQHMDLSKPVDLGRRFDLVYCIEVAEHIHGDFAEVFVDSISALGDRVLLSAARPGQGGMGHLNEQPRDYWIEKFERRGFRSNKVAEAALQAARDDYWENLMVLER